MAQLSDTVINGDLRISGQVSGGDIMAGSLADYNSTSSPIYLGYGNDSLTSASWLAGYTNVDSGMALKDISIGNVGVAYASHIGSSDSHPAIGATNRPVFVNGSGKVTAMSGGVGSDRKSLVYISNGNIQKSAVSKGNGNLPVYISNGEIKECAYQIDKRRFYWPPLPSFEESSQFSLYWVAPQSGGLVPAKYTPFTYYHGDDGRDILITYMFSNQANDGYALLNVDFISGNENNPDYHYRVHSIPVPGIGSATLTALLPEAWFLDSSTGDWREVKLLLSVEYQEASVGGMCGRFTGYVCQTKIYLDPR
jgi:hypothetical protein